MQTIATTKRPSRLIRARAAGLAMRGAGLLDPKTCIDEAFTMGLGIGGLGMLGLGSGVKAAAWAPTSLPGLVCFLDSRVGVTKDGNSLLTAWADQSGAGNNAAPAGGGVTHTGKCIASWANSQPAIQCSSTAVDAGHGATGPTQIVTSAFVGGALATFSILLVCDKTATSTLQVLADGIGASQRANIQQAADNTVGMYQGAGPLFTGSAQTLTTPRSLAFLFASDSANDSIYGGSSLIGGPGNAGTQTMTGLTLSGIYSGGLGLDGHIAAAAVCSGVLSATNVGRWATWANGIWGAT